MCLFVKDGEGVHAIDHDLTVYKILDLNNRSLVQQFQYLPHRTYKHDGTVRISHNNPFSAGYIEDGFHAYTDALAAEVQCVWSTKLVVFTIPKGANVCFGKFGEIVSDTIVAGTLKGKCSEPLWCDGHQVYGYNKMLVEKAAKLRI